MMNNNKKNSPWWEKLYDKNLAAILLDNTDQRDAENTQAFLEREGFLKQGDTIFDQCCGTGRLANVLAQNYAVIGVDLIPEYIESAKNKSTKNMALKQAPEFICADALQYTTPVKTDIALNWWTSFGYCTTDAENLRMLQCAQKSLKKGAYFVLDFMNVPGLYRHFEKDVMKHITTEEGDLYLHRQSHIDFKRGVLIKDWRYFQENKTFIHHTSEVKLYTPADLVKLFEAAGFTDIQLFGDLDSQALSLNSPRCIVVGKNHD